MFLCKPSCCRPEPTFFVAPSGSEGSLGTYVPRDDKKESVLRDDKKESVPREDKKESVPRDDIPMHRRERSEEGRRPERKRGMPRYRSAGQSRGGTFLNSLIAFMRTFQSAFFLKPIVFVLPWLE